MKWKITAIKYGFFWNRLKILPKIEVSNRSSIHTRREGPLQDGLTSVGILVAQELGLLAMDCS